MEKKWQYTLIGLGGFLLCGATTGVGTYLGSKNGYERGYKEGYNQGYEEGYENSEPEILFLNYQTHGLEGMCVKRNANEMVCSVDVDDNGSIDTIIYDPNTSEMKEATPGQDDCDSKYSRRKKRESPKQELP